MCIRDSRSSLRIGYPPWTEQWLAGTNCSIICKTFNAFLHRNLLRSDPPPHYTCSPVSGYAVCTHSYRPTCISGQTAKYTTENNSAHFSTACNCSSLPGGPCSLRGTLRDCTRKTRRMRLQITYCRAEIRLAYTIITVNFLLEIWSNFGDHPESTEQA